MAITTRTHTNTTSATLAFPFPYLKTEDVKVRKNGTNLNTTEYTVGATSITLGTAPSNSDTILI